MVTLALLLRPSTMPLENGAEIIEDQFAVPAEGSGDFFHRFDARPHDLTAPVVEELGVPCRGVVVPELLKVLLEEVGAHGLEVVSQQLAQAEALCGGQVGFAL